MLVQHILLCTCNCLESSVYIIYHETECEMEEIQISKS